MADTYNTTQANANLTAPGPGDSAGRPDRDNNGPIEKDFQNGRGNGYDPDREHLHADMDPDLALRKVQTAGSIVISPELFEKIYLSPQNRVKGELRKTFGNPTPYALVGFLLSLTPLSCDLMGWRGAGANQGNGAASIGAYLAFGGILMTLGSIGEFFLGNTFPMVVFGSFGAFWITFGLTLYPTMGSFADYAGLPGPDGSTSGTAGGLNTVAFRASFGFFLVFMGLLCLVYAICALRTNILFFLILLLLVPSFGCLTGAYWHFANGDMAKVEPLLIAGGAITFVIDMLGWYLFSAIMLASLDFPFSLPVGDLSRYVPGASDLARKRRQAENEA